MRNYRTVQGTISIVLRRTIWRYGRRALKEQFLIKLNGSNIPSESTPKTDRQSKVLPNNYFQIALRILRTEI